MQARPSANATGTRSTIRTAKLPNRIAATSPGDIGIPPHLDSPYLRQVDGDLLDQAQRTQHAGPRPGGIDRNHRQLEDLRGLHQPLVDELLDRKSTRLNSSH